MLLGGVMMPTASCHLDNITLFPLFSVLRVESCRAFELIIPPALAFKLVMSLFVSVEKELIEMFQFVFLPWPYGIYSAAHIVNAHSISYGSVSLHF